MYQSADQIDYAALGIRMILAACGGGAWAFRITGSSKEALVSAVFAASMAGEAYLRVPEPPPPTPHDSPHE